MFLHLSVILFTRGVCIPACNGADTTLGRHPSGQTPPGQTTPGQTPSGKTPHLDRHPPPDTTECGQQVGGTHPTGMHPCSYIFLFGKASEFLFYF